MTALLEARLYRTEEVGGVCGADRAQGIDVERNPSEVFLAEEELHPSLDEIFRQIDATHRRTLELERTQWHPAHARHGAR
ncbi:hypothetical protein DYQ86_02870 [Acidobacteria bacterium AB60]|nr:hypothetical protein DYQ86_02870 [Acidobacteria bacterium AB60]